MDLKTLLLPILLIALPIAASFAQTQSASQEHSGNAYGIEPWASYPGAVVLELMEAAEAEIDEAVKEAYAEGYKAGLLASLPDAVYFKALSESLETKLEREHNKVPRWVSFAAGCGGGFLLSFLIGR